MLRFVLIISGCVDVEKNIKLPFSGEPSDTYVAPIRHPEELPDHAEFTLAALLQKIRHQPLYEIVFDPKNQHDIVKNFDYKEFRVIKLDIAKAFDLKRTGQNPFD